MQTISVSEFKALCLRILREVRASRKPLLVTRDNEPLAVIYPPPLPKTKSKPFGVMRSQTKLMDDLVAPVDDAGWEALK